MNKDLVRQTSTAVAVALTIIVNIAANALPLNNIPTNEISDAYPLLVTPAGYVFSIWGVIYIGLVAYAVYQFLPAQRENPRLRKVGYALVWSCLANMLWLFAWHYGFQTGWFWLTEVFMVLILLSLIVIYLRLETGVTRVSTAESWCLRVPISIYLGWISIATIANTTITLYDWGWTGGQYAPWLSILLLVVGAILAVLMAIRHSDVAYVLVIVWAFIGVGVPNNIADNQTVSMVAYILAAILAILAVVTLVRKKELQPAAS